MGVDNKLSTFVKYRCKYSNNILMSLNVKEDAGTINYHSALA